MNAVFKRKPAEPLSNWGNSADAIARNGYCVVQCAASRVDEGKEPALNSYTASIHYAGNLISERDMDDAITILSQRLPHAGISNDFAMGSWISILRIDVRIDRKLVAAIESLIAPRLRWADGITTRHAPVRLSPDSSALLMVFRLDPNSGYHSPTAKSRSFKLPKDGTWDAPNVVSVTTAYGAFTASHHEWRDGLDLRAVNRDALPVMDQATATAIIDDVEKLLEARDVESWT
jgi:hypothetical protein